MKQSKKQKDVTILAYLSFMAEMEIAILSPHRHPRLRYLLGEAGRMLGYRFRLILDVARYQTVTAAARINYGGAPSGLSELRVAAHPFLAGQDAEIASEQASFFVWLKQGQGITNSASVETADPFAALFFCLSRWEEYQAGPRDTHGRFTAKQSHAYRHHYLEQPVVNIILCSLEKALQALFPALQSAKDRQVQLLPTYDVDIPYAYRQRAWRGLAAGLRDLLTGRFGRSWARCQSLLLGRADPFDTFAFLQDLHQRQGLPAHFFWLLAQRPSRLDPNPAPSNKAYRALIQATSQWAKMGIHPSYYSQEQATLVSEERQFLAELIGQPVAYSRQHFLRFCLPSTYRQLLLAGITQDFSMGYADAAGWRASTNLPFRWYDLEAEEASGLWVHPFAAMDVTLRQYETLAPAAAKQKIIDLYESIRPLGGPFILLWHNSSFAPHYGWAGWKAMYANLLQVLAATSPTTQQKDL